MDFWAQHKDFVLKVLAGLGVFLVALIARGITYGDDLERAEAQNKLLARKIQSMKIAPVGQIREMQKDAERLVANAETIATQIGWNLADDGLEVEILKRVLAYTRRFRDSPEATSRAVDLRDAIRQDVDGGFGQLRLLVRQELAEEANEKNISLMAGVGYEDVVQIEARELLKYLLQLELAARIVRYAIDANVDSVDDVEITTRERGEPIPDANPEFLQEYRVKVVFRSSPEALATILNRLGSELPRVPLRELEVRRLTRPADHVEVELSALAVAANPEVPFVKEEKGS